MSAPDVKVTANDTAAVDRAIEYASRSVDALLHRTFYPWTGTRYFDFPNTDRARNGRIWFGQYDLASLTSLTTQNGAVAIPAASVFLEPQDGPPYDRIEIDQSTVSAWGAGSTYQRSCAVTGVYCGQPLDEAPTGTVVEVLDATETGLDGSAMPLAGVGTILRVDSERMVVTDKAWLTTGQTTSLGSQMNNNSATVSDGTKFAAGETLLVDSERVLVTDVAGNVLTVKRAVQGSTLATHTTATVYAPRTLTVQRGALGTTAATHLIDAPAYRHVVTGPVSALSLAYAVANLSDQSSGFSAGGDKGKSASTTGVAALERAAIAACGRRGRTAAI